MAMTATIALGASTVVVNQPITVALTISNSSGASVNVLSVEPYVYTSSGTRAASVACQPSTLVSPLAVASSGSSIYYYSIVPLAPSNGPIGLNGGTYKVGAEINCSDGSNISVTPATLICNPQPAAGIPSLANSVTTVASSSIANMATDVCTLTMKDGVGNQLTSGGLTVVFAKSGGTAAGSFGATTDNGDGTYTATFTASGAGTATSIIPTVNGQNITHTAPTITVT